MEDNWYIILDLEFDPNPQIDERIIEERIEEKRKFWSTNSTRYKEGAKYRKYLEKVTDGTIKKDMIGDENRREQLIKEACETKYGPIDKFLERTSHGGEITDDELKEIADHHKTSIDVVRRRASALGIKIEKAKPKNYQAVYDEYYNYTSLPEDGDTFFKYDRQLSFFKPFHVDNLYDFLALDNQKGTEVEKFSYAALKKMAVDKQEDEFRGRHDSISSSGKNCVKAANLLSKMRRAKMYMISTSCAGARKRFLTKQKDD